METTRLLAEVLDNDLDTANLLAAEIHRDVILSEVPIERKFDGCNINIDINDLGIWIDPIGIEDITILTT